MLSAGRGGRLAESPGAQSRCSALWALSKLKSAAGGPVRSHADRAALQAATAADGATPSRPVTALFRFDAANREASLAQWERVDDVIMGGVSKSALVSSGADEEAVLFSGVLRSEGGGFCGQRTKLMTEALDLSSFEGIYLKASGDLQTPNRIHKMSLRTKQDRGEVIYSAEFKPSLDLEYIFVPFSDFQLVRGPRLVIGAPPVDPQSVYQISLTCTKFHIAENTTTLPNFQPGPFSLRVAELGVFQAPSSGSPSPVAPVIVPAVEAPNAAGKSRPLALKILTPLSKLVFSEKVRRRRLAENKLRSRGLGLMSAAQWGIRRTAKKVGFAAAVAIAFRRAVWDIVCRASAIPLRLLFRLAFAGLRLRKSVVQGFRKTLNKSNEASSATVAQSSK